MHRVFSLTTRLFSIAFFLAIAFVVAGKASQAQAACTASQPGGLTGSIVITGCATNETVSGFDFKGTAPAGVTTNEGCIGFSGGKSPRVFGNGTHTPAPGAGQCHQIDVVVGGKSYGVARYGGAAGKVCGETCVTTADCKNPSGNGATVACVNGTCQNATCAPGMTIPGANCSCGANARLCGQTCSGALGLCGPGQGSCTYVNGPTCTFGSTTYCTRDGGGYKKNACTSGDTGGQYLVTPAGKSTGLTPAEIAASCAVCGNGDVDAGEECDEGPNNGKAGSRCDFTCKRIVTCNDACTTDAQCGGVLRNVKLVLRTSGVNVDMLLDYVKDGSTIIDSTSPLLKRDGTFNNNTDSAPYGGSYAFTKTNGNSITYSTYSDIIVARLYSSATRGNVDVYVDNVLKQTLTPYNTGSGWTDFSITVGRASTYVCAPVGTGKACRMRSNPSDATCGGGTTVSPTPTASSSPAALVCDLTPTYTSNGNAAAWKYGDMITFSVPAIPASRIPTGGSARYEGEVRSVRNNATLKTVTLTPINATASIFQPMKVEAANANYYFRFRYCVKPASGTETCTAWGAWGAP